MREKETVILIPAYNEKPRIGSVLKVVCSYKRKSRVVVIDDGSEDDTEKSAVQYPVEILRHDQNKGKGAALQTGIEYIGEAPYWIILDADLINLKHEHIEALYQPLKENPKMGMTVGMLQKGGKLGVDLAQKYFGILNGQRGLSSRFVKSLPDLSWSRFGVEIFLTKIAQSLEIPIAMPLLNGLTHHIKESKLGYLAGSRYRMQMYKECLFALYSWKKYMNK